MSQSIAITLSSELRAKLQDRAAQEGVSLEEAVLRCLKEWALTGKPRKTTPSGRLTTTDREASFSNPAESDRAGADERGNG